MYNCVGSSVLGSYVGDLLGFRPGLNTGWEERTLVGLAPGGTPVGSLDKSDGVRGR